jgi:hypothetical protein
MSSNFKWKGRTTATGLTQTTYEAAAKLAKWDRTSLERGHDPRSAS